MTKPETSRPLLAVLSILALLSLDFNAFADTNADAPADSFSEAFGRSNAYLSFRYRYEYVDEASFTEKAKASTLRTRFGLETGEYRDWKLGIEFNNITNSTITVTYSAINNAGTTIINGLSVPIGANTRADRDIHTAAGQAQFGLVTVTHDGPLGAILANVSQYEGTLASFSLSATIPCQVRPQTLS